MKKLLISIAILIFPLFNQAQINIPDFTLDDSYGNSHHLYSYLSNGDAVIIDFFMLSCGNCMSFAPDLEQIFQDFGANSADVKMISMEVSDTASNQSINNWKNSYGTYYPTIGGNAAYSYWDNNFKPHFGSVVNQIMLIIPNTSNPSASSLPYIEIGQMDSSKIQNLYNMLETYGYAVGFNQQKMPSFTVSPNPASESIRVLFSESVVSDQCIIKLYDMSGREVDIVCDWKNFQNLEIRQKNKRTGLYILHIATDRSQRHNKIQIL